MGFLDKNVDRPTNKYIDWSGSKGVFKYYDKEVKEDVLLPKAFQFVPLEVRYTVKGLYKKDKKDKGTGIFSNEVSNLKKQPLRVRTFRGDEIASGLWGDVKASVDSAGGKFANSVYGLLLSKKGNEIVNFQFYGSSIGAWIESNIKPEQKVIVKATVNPETQVNGNVEYYEPKFESKPIENEELMEECKSAYLAIIEYLDSKSDSVSVDDTPPQREESPSDNGSRFDSVPMPTESDELIADEDDDLPF